MRSGRRNGRNGGSATRSGRRAPVFALVAIWALLLQTLIPLFHTPPARAGADGIPAWVLTSLCLGAQGAGQAPIGSAGDPAKQSPIDTQPACPICLGLHQAGTFTEPLAVSLAAPTAVAAVDFVDRQPRAAPGLHRSSALARAPPIPA
jgi:hypothetical protein